MKPVPDGLTHDQDQVLTGLTRDLESDSRIEGAWLVGSLARGLGDRFSDLDVLVAVPESLLPGIVDGWPARASSLVDVAFARTVYSAPRGTTFTHVTSGYVRFDVTFTTPDLARNSSRNALPLVGSSPVDLSVGEPDGRGPDADRVRKLSEEFLRVLGLLPVVIGRREYLVGASGAALLRSMLMDLCAELTSAEYRGGAMRLEKILSPGHLEVLRSLPPLVWTREAVIDLHLACASRFLPVARRASEDLGLVWPQAFEDAVRNHLRRELDLELS
jgi:Nucleotidyltransferase domain